MECKNINKAEKIQRSMTRYVFNCAEVDYTDCLLMNILSLTVLFAFESAYGARDGAHDFVSFFSDGGCTFLF